jgi:lipoyl(octanoyl) transferase
VNASPTWLVSPKAVSYPDALKAMETYVDAVIEGEKPEQIWLLQHPPLYTGGTSADKSELKDENRFPVYETGRGGRYTYHGPGQRVIYAIVDLRERGKDLRQHVWRLEEWVLRVLADLGVTAERREGRIGLWVKPIGVEQNAGEEKIAAIGVRVRKWVAYHGLSLNVAPDLSHFEGIVPCGIADFGVTSLQKLGVKASMEEVDALFKKHLPTLLGDKS